ncbi:hypothetical protein PZB74_11495 [Porifericola rhodea]|uniref:hypothetical protein n=1 Tax=Porifericola rhodea TaxID=930972 RepID=UPI002665691A|nr:hypothetical protein [Porifericola rhodea]WKN29588.1 hypothetical protein PZB74_11495 [Porifericola rhodea]
MSTTFFSCGINNEKEQLHTQIDSLELELQNSQQAARVLEEVGILMDSIDASRNFLAINMEMGADASYTMRMESIQAYIAESQARVAELEKTLLTSESASKTYASSIKKLKKEIADKNVEMQMLQQQVVGLQTENNTLLSTVAFKEEEISLKTAEIMARTEELAQAEARIKEMIIQQKISQADAYYARAEAVEEVARRTQLVRQKKKEAYKEALTLYEKSFALGRTDARTKMESLKEKVR